jgi:DNA-binding NtrC family response regulator
MDRSRIKILVVDDERGLCAGIQEALRREGYVVDAASDAAAALRLVGEHLYNLVLSDIRMPGLSGLDLLRKVKERSRDTVFLLMTAFGTVESAVEAMKEGAHDYLTKPLDMQRLRGSVLKALEFQALVAENNELRLRLRKRSEPSLLIGQSEGLNAVRRTLEEVAQSDVTVLIEGESGTGKEIVARSIHQASLRRDRPFITINCAALPEALVEAELFGHVRGAFTGAVANRPGRFQLADGGTLFLDEIGDLPGKGQGDLLRVLEDGTFRSVGGTELVQVNVRVVAATNQRLLEAVAAGRFREDLFYRLQVVPIFIPPLRERPEDIPLLVDAFLDHFAAKHKRRRLRVSPDALQQLQRFPWPGNVRQLRNVVERLVVTGHGNTVGPEHLPDFVRSHGRTAPPFVVRPGMALAEVEKVLIQQTLRHVTDNRALAAQALGISRRTLQYKLKEYGLLGQAGPAQDPASARPRARRLH